MENSISVYGSFNQSTGTSSDENHEENIPSEKIFVASEISTGSLPKTSELTSFDFVFLGILLCLIAMILWKLTKTEQKNIQ